MKREREREREKRRMASEEEQKISFLNPLTNKEFKCRSVQSLTPPQQQLRHQLEKESLLRTLDYLPPDHGEYKGNGGKNAVCVRGALKMYAEIRFVYAEIRFVYAEMPVLYFLQCHHAT